MEAILTKEDLQVLRSIRIHRILNLPDSGRDIKIKCPVHNERTPSFVVYPDNSYHCFGCSAHGFGAIDFLKDLGFNFRDSVKELSEFL